MQRVVQAQQKSDAAAATVNNNKLNALVKSGATGAQLYKGYIDVIVADLQQAINAIDDSAVQAQVAQYAQNQFAMLKASANGNRYNSRTLGRMNSKKSMKKSKHA